jgi:PAS domain S-box-containing protein
VLTVGITERCPLNAAETSLLEQLARDISFAFNNFKIELQPREEAVDTLKRREVFETVLENALDGFYLVDLHGRLLEVNGAYCAMSGYTREELLQMRVADLESAESERDIAAHIEQIVRHGKDRFESRHHRKDGQIINIETSVQFLGIDGGRLFCFLRDITDRKRAEQALRESEERFRHVVEGAPVGMFIQTDGVFQYMNSAALAMFGAETADQIVGHALAERIHSDSRASVNERLKTLKEGRKAIPFKEEQHLRLDGTAFDTETGAIPFIFEGRPGVVAFIRDVTERKRAEKTLRETEEARDKSYWYIRKLHEVLPFCMGCKKVKSTQASWESLENFLTHNADFLSHCYCPECLEKWRKENQ